MENEIGAESKTRLNLKQGRGGLVDVEFVAQMMALAHGHRASRAAQARDPRSAEELEWLQLITGDEAAALRDGYEFIARLENRLRIESDQPAWALPTDPEALRPLARRMGYQGSGGAAPASERSARAARGNPCGLR